jgi:hypothetical protein
MKQDVLIDEFRQTAKTIMEKESTCVRDRELSEFIRCWIDSGRKMITATQTLDCTINTFVISWSDATVKHEFEKRGISN